MLVGASGLDLGTELLGVARPHPIIVAPTAFQQLVHPDGELGIARAAEATNTVMCVSTLASARRSGRGGAIRAADDPLVPALRVLGPGGDARARRGAAVHGYEALVVTVDRPVLGLRERERRSRVREAGAPMRCTTRPLPAARPPPTIRR